MRNRLVADKALEWVGVKFAWQGETRHGCDCKGLVLGIARELGFAEAEDPAFLVTAYRGDRPLPHEQIKASMSALFDEVTEAIPGDILLCLYDGKPGHFAIVVDNDHAVHARIGRGVRRHPIKVLTHKSRFPLHSVWRWKNV